VACRKVGSPRFSQVRQLTVSRCPEVGKHSGLAKANCMGPSNINLVALLTRGSASSRAVEPSRGVVHDDQESRRSFEQNPSLLSVVSSELGHVARFSVVGNTRWRCQPARLYQEGQPVYDGQQRIVDQAKAWSNAQDTGVVPGHRKMELNSTTAEEVKVYCCSRGYERKAC